MRVELEISLGGFWEGLILCRERRKWVALCTSRLIQRRYQGLAATSCTCTGANGPPFLPFPRLKDDWVVGYIKGGLTTELKASVGAVPNQPPTAGWKSFNYNTNKDEVDESLSCSSICVSSPPCCLTISLSGAAKEFQGKCEGEYKSTGLVSMGREVMII